MNVQIVNRMDTSILDTTPIGIAEVMERYGIKSRTTLFNWLKRANIQTFKRSKNAFIYAYQLSALDEVEKELRRLSNPSTVELVQPVQEYLQKMDSSVNELNLSVTLTPPNPEDWMPVILAMHDLNRSKVLSLPEKLSVLDQAAEHGWLMLNNEIVELLHIPKLSLIVKSPYCARGFWFFKQGKTKWWKVSKNPYEMDLKN